MLVLNVPEWFCHLLQQSVTSESEAKENKGKVMKPPSSNGVRRARVARTPTKGTTPVKTAGTPGKSQSATKLPLRSNANVSWGASLLSVQYLPWDSHLRKWLDTEDVGGDSYVRHDFTHKLPFGKKVDSPPNVTVEEIKLKLMFVI